MDFELNKDDFETSVFHKVNYKEDFFNIFNSKMSDKKRINGIDTSILEDSSLQNLQNTDLVLEEKIKRTESHLKALDSKLKSARLIHDLGLQKDLESQINALTKLLNSFKDQYKNRGPAQAISETINDGASYFFQRLKSLGDQDLPHFLIKFFPSVYRSFITKKAMSNLEILNKSAKELIKTSPPIGEEEVRTRHLASFISEANRISVRLEKRFKK